MALEAMVCGVPPCDLPAPGVVDVPHQDWLKAAAVAVAGGVVGVTGVQTPPHRGRPELGKGDGSTSDVARQPPREPVGHEMSGFVVLDAHLPRREVLGGEDTGSIGGS